jgi:hypothetical protein
MPSGARVIMRPLAHKELENSVGKVDCNASAVLDTADGLSGARGGCGFCVNVHGCAPLGEGARFRM